MFASARRAAASVATTPTCADVPTVANSADHIATCANARSAGPSAARIPMYVYARPARHMDRCVSVRRRARCLTRRSSRPRGHSGFVFTKVVGARRLSSTFSTPPHSREKGMHLLSISTHTNNHTFILLFLFYLLSYVREECPL